MIFFKKEENKIINKFLKNGYYIGKEDKNLSTISINVLRKNITKKKKFNFNTFHKYNKVKDLNKIRVKILNNLNKNRLIRNKYFNLAREHLYALVGNELMMRKVKFKHSNT